MVVAWALGLWPFWKRILRPIYRTLARNVKLNMDVRNENFEPIYRPLARNVKLNMDVRNMNFEPIYRPLAIKGLKATCQIVFRTLTLMGLCSI